MNKNRIYILINEGQIIEWPTWVGGTEPELTF